jgi:flagellar biosynthesis protein FliQ
MSPDSLQFVIDAGREALLVTLKLSVPLLAVGLVVGLSVSIVQAVTQIQEQTLSFIPKILAVVATLIFLMPWMLSVIVEYTRDVLARITENF